MSELTALLGKSGKAIDFLGNSEILLAIAELVKKRDAIAAELARLQSPMTVEKWLKTVFDLSASDDVAAVLKAVGLEDEYKKPATMIDGISPQARDTVVKLLKPLSDFDDVDKDSIALSLLNVSPKASGLAGKLDWAVTLDASANASIEADAA